MSERRESSPIGALRQKAIDVLCEAFAEDTISIDEFERRVERAHEAEGSDELKALLADLPSTRRLTSPPPKGLERASEPRPVTPRGPADSRDHALPPLAAIEEVAERGFVVGVLGGARKRGRWLPARHTISVGVLGGVELDLRDAIFPPGVSELHAIAFCGGVEVVVPPGIRVDVSGLGFLGGFDHEASVAPTDHPDAPVLRIRGVAFLGGVDVKVRYPGESKRDARRRLRHERRLRRRLHHEARGRLGRGKTDPRGRR